MFLRTFFARCTASPVVSVRHTLVSARLLTHPRQPFRNSKHFAHPIGQQIRISMYNFTDLVVSQPGTRIFAKRRPWKMHHLKIAKLMVTTPAAGCSHLDSNSFQCDGDTAGIQMLIGSEQHTHHAHCSSVYRSWNLRRHRQRRACGARVRSRILQERCVNAK